MTNAENILINKDLILREKLAIERTKMANTTTLLSFIRTALYFMVAGLSINNLLTISYGKIIEIACWIIGGIIFVTGVFNYQATGKSIRKSRRHIGNYQLDYEKGDTEI